MILYYLYDIIILVNFVPQFIIVGAGLCLENIGKISQFEESKENTENTKFNLEKFLEDLIKKYKHRNRNKGPYMITPCHHVFHSKCFEMWLEQKNECPYCRQRIPPLEP